MRTDLQCRTTAQVLSNCQGNSQALWSSGAHLCHGFYTVSTRPSTPDVSQPEAESHREVLREEIKQIYAHLVVYIPPQSA